MFDCYFLCLKIYFVSFLLTANLCYFLFLDKKKVTKSAGWRKGCRLFWGSCFSACPRNTTRSTSFHSVSLKQYCLQQAHAASLKTVALSQNNLRPFETQV